MAMNIRHKAKHTACAAALLAAALLPSACADDLFDRYGNENVPAGEDASVTLSWDVLESALVSRSTAMSEADESKVNSLWVGVYNVASGKLTSQHLFESENADWATESLPLENGKDISLEGTKSGVSYIVAVANVRTNYGIMDCDLAEGETLDYETLKTDEAKKNGTETARPRVPLYVLLQKADTWERFRAISSVLLTPGSLTRSTADFPMTGYYISGDHPGTWYDDDGNPKETVAIYPGSNKLAGKIHLRRQEAYVRFKVKGGENITVTPVSWQVVNIPSLSPLLENGSNVGDESKGLTRRPDNLYSGVNYSVGTVNTAFDDGTATDGTATSDFDFYCFGSNRQSKWAEEYADRELEWKNADGTNTGIYKALCAESRAAANDAMPSDIPPGNNAMYVVLTCDVSYDADSNNEPVAAGTTHRTGTGVFTIHLGYCDGDDVAAKSKDFSCLRNTRYTYNVTVEGIDNIRVEAVREGENQPGMEGSVTDSGEETITLDAHYCTFNIVLTNQERALLSYEIEAPIRTSSGSVTTYTYSSKSQGLDYGTQEKNPQAFLCDWVRFRPTYAKDKLAVYKNTNISGYGEPWTFSDLQDVLTNKPVTDVNGNTGFTKNAPTEKELKNYVDAVNNGSDVTNFENTYKEWLEESHYYTVFVDEYVYQYDSDGVSNVADNTLKDWKVFTDLPERKLWLMNEDVRQNSTDGESSYIKSKYLISQRSIETYYSTEDYNTTFISEFSPSKYNSETNISSTAIGIEHYDESLGAATRTWSVTTGGLDANNGRYNVWLALGGNENGRSVSGKYWYDLTKTDKSTSNENSRWIDPVKITSDIEYQNSSVVINESGTKPLFDVGNEMMYQCMNRNRDEDGDGVIDADELKWYVPTANMYYRMIIGDKSLSESLLGLNRLSQYAYTAGESGDNYTHHFTSDYKALWTDEGYSLSDGFGYYGSAQRLRCVRLLGVDISTVPKTTRIQPVYRIFDNDGNEALTDNSTITDLTEGGYIVMQYVEEKNNATPLSAALPIHNMASDLNKTSFAIQFGGSDKEVKLDYGTNSWWSNSGDLKTAIANNPCAKFNSATSTGWRPPSAEELALLYILQSEEGLDIGINENYRRYNSCTTEYFNSQGHRLFGVHKTTSSLAPSVGALQGEDNYVRCVRDVILK